MRLFFILVCLVPLISTAQSVGVNTNTPHASAQLDISSTSKGLLPPRMTSQQRINIVSPAAGLVVYDTDENQLYLFNGTVWAALSTGSNGNTVIPIQYTQDVSDLKLSGEFGFAVSMGDGYAVAGSQKDDGTVPSCGSVYIFKKSAVGAWSLVTKLFASDQQTDAAFGASVKMAGNYIVVGAPFHDVSGQSNAGKIYLFVKGVGDTWTQQTAIQRGIPAQDDYFGYSVAISLTTTGAVLIAGAPYAGASNTGNITVYRNVAGVWNFQTITTPVDLINYDLFGSAIDVDGDYCAISAPSKDNGATNAAGAVYIFNYASNTWSQQEMLEGAFADIGFGSSLDLDGSLLLVGAPVSSPSAARTEDVRLYSRTGSSWNYIAVFYLYYSWGQDVFNFGRGLALDNDNVLIGAPSGFIYPTGQGSAYLGKRGAAFLYKKYSTGNIHNMTKIINDNEALPQISYSNCFGTSISMKNGDYIIGIPNKTVNGVIAGAVAFGVY